MTKQTKTYTIALLDDMLLATVPDGSNIMLAAAEQIHEADLKKPDGNSYTTDDDIKVISGLTLSNELPDDADLVYTGHHCGWLMDENNVTYQHAYFPKQIKLTPKEQQLLDAITTGMDEAGCGWLHELSPFADDRTNSGVVSSLVKKGLIISTKDDLYHDCYWVELA